MKRFLAFILSGAIIISAAACSSQGNTPTSGGATQNATEGPSGTAEPVGLTGEISGEITVSCYDSMTYQRYLTAAAEAFEEKFPGTKVNINTFSAMPEVRTSTSADGSTSFAVMQVDDSDDIKAQSDYMTQINTEMISGGGADLYAADILPYYKYALNGQLEDLSTYMNSDSDFDISDYRENIFEAAKFNGGQYILPLNYSFDALSYNAELMDDETESEFSIDGKHTYEQLVEMGLSSFESNYNADEESPLKMFNLYSDVRDRGNSFLTNLFNANYNTFVDIINKNANFADGKLTGILELAKEYEEKGYLNTRVDMGFESMDMESIRESMRRSSSQSYLYKSSDESMLLQYFNNDDTTTGRRMMMTIGGGGALTEDDELAGVLTNDKGEAAFEVSQAFMMNTNSKNKRTAWEFIKFLLSPEMQTSLYLNDLPVNIEGFAEKTKQQITGEIYAGMMLQARDFEGGGNRGGERQGPEGGVRITPEGPVTVGTDEESEAEEVNEGTEPNEIPAGEVPEGAEFESAEAEEGVFFGVPGFGTANVNEDGEYELTEAQEEMYANYMEAIEILTSSLNYYMIHDTIIDDMISTEVQNYFDGSRSAEQVASALQSKIDMYLKE